MTFTALRRHAVIVASSGGGRHRSDRRVSAPAGCRVLRRPFISVGASVRPGGVDHSDRRGEVERTTEATRWRLPRPGSSSGLSRLPTRPRRDGTHQCSLLQRYRCCTGVEGTPAPCGRDEPPRARWPCPEHRHTDPWAFNPSGRICPRRLPSHPAWALIEHSTRSAQMDRGSTVGARRRHQPDGAIQLQ
jgi:hypothetical protein